jgi:hypothetical protein
MQIKNKYYPYPVIAAGNDSYEDATFTSDADYAMDAHNVKLILCAETDNQMLNEMIKSGSVKYAHHIECQQTCFRKLVLTDEKVHEEIIHESLLNGIVQICTFLMANEDLVGYANPNFAKDYRGIKFNLDKGCVMAIGSQVNITINKDKEDLSRTSSIFSIRRDHDPSHTELQVSTTGAKIVVLIPEKTCNQYLNLSNQAMFVPVLHSMVIMPALMQVLSELKEAAQQNVLYNYEELRWFRGLKKTAEKLQIKFDQDALTQINAFKTAQQFLDTPVVKALANICSGEGEDNG